MGLLRRCSRTACGHAATTTLTYVYADMTAVVGPLATYAEPHAYDLCDAHAERLSAPRGWEVLRLAVEDPRGPSSDDLLALADAVREAAQPRPVAVPAGPTPLPTLGGHPTDRAGSAPAQGARRGHLRALRSDPDAQ